MTIRRVIDVGRFPAQRRPSTWTPAWGRHLLQAACDEIRASAAFAEDPENGWHATLRRKAYRVGRLMPGGYVNEDEAREQLLAAALDAAHWQAWKRDLLKIIDSRLAKGAKAPRRPRARG